MYLTENLTRTIFEIILVLVSFTVGHQFAIMQVKTKIKKILSKKESSR